MIDSYKDMKLHHLLEIQALTEVDAPAATKELMIVSILSGIAPEELRKMPTKEYDALRSKAEFLAEPAPPVKEVIREVEINGTVYTICKDMQEISTGQYIDWCTYMQGEKNLADLYSICCIPKGHKYGEGYSFEQAKADMNDMPISVASYISVFWKASQELYLRHLARLMKIQARKIRKRKMTPQQKEMLGTLKEQIAKVESQLATGGILSQLSAQNSATRPRRWKIFRSSTTSQ